MPYDKSPYTSSAVLGRGRYGYGRLYIRHIRVYTALVTIYYIYLLHLLLHTHFVHKYTLFTRKSNYLPIYNPSLS